MRLFRSFIQFCKAYPSPAKVLFTGTLFSLSDIVTQLLVEKQPFNFKRNLIFFLSGTLYIGPCLEIWYMYLLPKIVLRYFQNCSKLKRVLGSIGFDQLLFAPILYGAFYFVKQFLSNPSLSALKDGYEEFNSKFLDTLLLDYMVWPIANFINFWYISPFHQSMYVSVITFFFNIAFSYIANAEKKK